MRKRTLAAIVGTIVIGIALYAHHQYTAEWRRVQARLTTAGETLNPAELVRPHSFPETENFAATPALKNIRINKEKLHALENIVSWDSFYETFSVGNFDQAKPANFEDILEYLQQLTENKETRNLSEADNILLLIDSLDSTNLLAELESVAFLPESAFIPIWNGNLGDHEIFYSFSNLARTLELRAAASAHAGKHEQAAQSIAALISLSKAIYSEPTFISSLLSSRISYQATNTLWEATRIKALSSNDLKNLQQLLSGVNLKEKLLWQERTELIVNANRPNESHLESTSENIDIASILVDISTTLSRSQRKSRLVEWRYEDIILPLERGFPELSQSLKTAETVRIAQFSDNKGIADSITLSRHGLHLDSAHLYIFWKATLSLMEASCALERHFLAHGYYPESLSHLVPNFLDRIPEDPADGAPIRYLKDQSNRRYKLYSLGFDLTDNGGETHLETPSRYNHPTYKGDWTWRYPEL